MNALTEYGGERLMSSLQIAELSGKPHNDLMKAIRKMEPAWVKTTQGNFSLSKYQDSTGRSLPCYLLTKDECLYIATKFNDEARARLIRRWHELEEEAVKRFEVPQTFREALLLAARQQEQIEEQQRLIMAQGQTISDLNEANAEMRVKVSYYDQILASKSTVATTQIAQDYGLSAIKFNALLHRMRIQRKVGEQWILYAPYNTQGYVHSETFIPEASKTGRVVMHTRWTQKGRLFLYDKLKQEGILPVIER